MAGMVLEHSMSTHYSNIIKASNELKKLFKPDAVSIEEFKVASELLCC